RQMVRFWERDADVLVCTTIIESGLDVPNANTLVVDRADMLGLAQLYQLRGRVGRATERAFAYLFFPAQREMTEDAHERLFAIASLRLTARRLGITEIGTFREQVRISPVNLSDAMQVDLGERVRGATYHPAKATLNLVPERVFGVELVRWAEGRLREAVGE